MGSIVSESIDGESIDGENRIWGSTDGENKTGADYKTLDNNQTGSIDDIHRILILHSLLHPILQFQEIPIHLLALYTSPFLRIAAFQESHGYYIIWITFFK
ncbi:hypothetical protein [Sporomusa ovata]|uniref:Uncharacterized protein n=1 Tax=Sporomusa ovata TaxID=2378 RepID=A0A0U1L675_9FIRM|nr:hypothetical protein [Sporomusa ovata]CQR74779.1 hypothetical protein SpAn4DRAFT_4136 [Sporomusa ovata]